MPKPDHRWFAEASFDEEADGDLRTVAVVGAGASPFFESQDLIREIDRDPPGSQRQLDQALDRYARANSLEAESLEAHLGSLLTPREREATLRLWIAERFDRRQPTQLHYEFLAHLMRHRFLDAIISFNFDELLDQSLKDELSEGEFVHIVSERDCLHVQTDASQPDYKPLFVKLHGTASEPDLLRFTHEDYAWIPDRIAATLTGLLTCRRCALVTMGYGLRDLDLHRLLQAPARLDVFHVNPEPLPSKTRKQLVQSRHECGRSEETLTVSACTPASWTQRSSEDPRAEGRLDGMLTETVASLSMEMAQQSLGLAIPNKKRRPLAHWRSLLRHEAAVGVLGTHDETDDEHFVGYLRRRAVIELAFAAAKGRGLVAIEALVSDRPGGAYEEYCRAHRGSSRRGKPQTWAKLCQLAGLVPDPESPPGTYRIAQEIGQDEAMRRMLESEDSGLPEALKTHVLRPPDPNKLAEAVLHRLDPFNWPRDFLKNELQEDGVDNPRAEASERALKGLTANAMPNSKEVDRLSKRLKQIRQLDRPFVYATWAGLRAGEIRDDEFWEVAKHEKREAGRKISKSAKRTFDALTEFETTAKEGYGRIADRDVAARTFKDALSQLLTGTEIEIHATDDRVCAKVFDEPFLLPTLTALQGWTRKILLEAKVGSIWVSAESGAWLSGMPLERQKIELIAAFFPENEGYAKRKKITSPDPTVFGGSFKGKVERVMLPWWRHNRHMTVFWEAGRVNPIAAIYYARRARTAKVTPVLLQNPADLRRMIHMFEVAHKEACTYTRTRLLDDARKPPKLTWPA